MADLTDLPSELSAYGIPELWVVTRDLFLDPCKHVDSLNARLGDAKLAYSVAKQELRDMIAERRRRKKQRAAESNETKQNILENEIDALTLDIEQATTQLAERKQHVLASRSNLNTALQPSTVVKTPAHGDVFIRLAKPNRAITRVQARLNGNDKMAPEPCLGTSMEELFLSCAKRLKMRVAKRLYTMDGKRVRQFTDLQQGQEVCASAGEPFVDPSKRTTEGTMHKGIESLPLRSLSQVPA